MPVLKDERHELFAQNLFQFPDVTDGANYLNAGFTCKHNNARSNASKLLSKNPTIHNRVAELQSAVASEKIMDKTERMEILSEIGRGRLVDFVHAGPDGSWVDVGLESLNSRAIKKVKSRTEYDREGTEKEPTVIIELELHDPKGAIDLLNRMDGAYAAPELIINHRVERVAIVRSKP